MTSAGELLAAARDHFDEPRHGLDPAARSARWGGFRGGALWMRRAMTSLRGRPPTGDAAFHRLGFAKYSFAMLAALAMIAASAAFSWWLLPLAVVAFYAIECRMVFAFPLALDGSRRPLRDSHALVRATTSATAATAIVMRIASEMLAGGFFGRGFVRSWCVGCMAVLLWYERARVDGSRGS